MKLPTANSRSTHIAALDGIRGIAILAVLGLHLFSEDRQPNPALNSLYRLTASGWIGVDLFFVLSGFLITGILLDSRGSKNSLRNFYARRTLRIFPLYYGLVICGWIAAYCYWKHDPTTNGPYGFKANQLWLWTYTTNFRAAHLITDTVPGFNAGRLVFIHFWTLAIEEQFYIAWPLIVLRLSTRTLAKVCAIILAVGPLARWWYFSTTNNANVIYLDTPFHLDGLVAGAMAAIVFRSAGISQMTETRRSLLITVGLASVVGMVVYLQRLPNPLVKDGFISTAGYSILALGFAMLVLGLASAPKSDLCRRAMEVRPLRLLGKYSYGIYALHLPLISLAGERSFNVTQSVIGRGALCDFIAKLLLAACILCISFMSYHFYEKPWLQLKRYFPQHEVSPDGPPFAPSHTPGQPLEAMHS